MSRRIDPHRTTVEEAAQRLVEKLGKKGAATEAHRRYEGAKSEVTVGFYEQVLAEILRVQRLERFIWQDGDIRPLDRREDE